MFKKHSGVEKIWIKRGHQIFPSKRFCLTVPKNFVGEPFCVSKNSGKHNLHA